MNEEVRAKLKAAFARGVRDALDLQPFADLDGEGISNPEVTAYSRGYHDTQREMAESVAVELGFGSKQDHRLVVDGEKPRP